MPLLDFFRRKNQVVEEDITKEEAMEVIEKEVEEITQETSKGILIDKDLEFEEEEIVPVKKFEKFTPKSSGEYVSKQIISPMRGIQKEQKEDKKENKKPVKKVKEEHFQIISPIKGRIPLKKEPAVIVEENNQKVVIKAVDKEEMRKTTDGSVTEELRSVSQMIDEEADVKLVESKTGEFQIEFRDPVFDETSFNDEIDDNMTIDQLLDQYERRNRKD